MKSDATVQLNGRSVDLPDEPQRLLDWLRSANGLVSPRYGCGQGQCGACTVLVDDRPMLACLLMTPQVEGRAVFTLEGLAENQVASVIQRVFADTNAFQCGYCASGFVLALFSWLHDPDAKEDLRTVLQGNVCRCTGYLQVLEACCEAARQVSRSQESTRSG